MNIAGEVQNRNSAECHFPARQLIRHILFVRSVIQSATHPHNNVNVYCLMSCSFRGNNNAYHGEVKDDGEENIFRAVNDAKLHK